jgi:hypothetical protein
MAVPTALWWHRHSSRTARAAAVTLLVASLAITAILAFVDRGALLYNLRDGYALWFDWVAPAVNLATAWPSLFQHTPQFSVVQAVAWVVAAAFGWWTLRFVETRAQSPGGFRLVAGLAAAVVIMLGATIGWALSGATAEEPGASSLRVLAQACKARRRLYDLVSILPAGRFGDSPQLPLAIPNASRRPMSAASPIWAGRDVPPGRYRVVLRSGLNVTGSLRVALGRPDSLMTTCSFGDAPPGPSSCVVELPAGATSLWISADKALHETVDAVDLALDAFATDDCDLRASRTVTTESGIFFVDASDVFAETGGAWVVARGEGRLLVPPSSSGLRIRNGARANVVTIEVDGSRDRRQLAPGEVIDVSVHPPPGRVLARVTIRPEDGFHPVDVDPANKDFRWLGVWVEPLGH